MAKRRKLEILLIFWSTIFHFTKTIEATIDNIYFGPITSTLAAEEDYFLESEFEPICGKLEDCFTRKLIDGNNNNETELIPDTHPRYRDNFAIRPYLCRCDPDKCSIYGDCCPKTILDNKIPLKKADQVVNEWKCRRFILKNAAVYQISECPKESSSFLSRNCRREPDSKFGEVYTYLHDLPVFLNMSKIYEKESIDKDKNVFRNIFCAFCHGVKRDELYKWSLKISCQSIDLDLDNAPKDGEFLLKDEDYVKEEFTWRKRNNTCRLSVTNIRRVMDIDYVVPNIRFCGFNTIDSCPPDYSSSSKISRLCHSYTQHVYLNESEEFKIYKNPHCALCNQIEMEKSETFSPICYEYEFAFMPGIIIRQGPGAIGLNYLFDFGFGEEPIGLKLKCKENELWDFIKKSCQPIFCPNEYELIQNKCRLSSTSSATAKKDEFYSNDNDDDMKRKRKVFPARMKIHPQKNGNRNQSSSEEKEEEEDCVWILLIEGEFHFLHDENNSILVNSTDLQLTYGLNDYHILNETSILICNKNFSDKFQLKFSPALNYISVTAMGISLVFLFLHILIFIIVPKTRNLPGKNLFSLTLALFLSQLLFVTMMNLTKFREICLTSAILQHYFWLSSFFWMSFLSFDIYRTFSSSKMLQSRNSRQNKSFTFIKYSILAWGIPVLILALAISIDFIDMNYPDGTTTTRGESFYKFLRKIKPMYATQEGVCWINNRLSLLVFFGIPIAIIVILNIFFFSMTAWAIWTSHEENKKMLNIKNNKKDSNKKGGNFTNNASNRDELRFKLYIKLGLIMGLSWTLGFLAALLTWEWLWIMFVVFNGLQGTFIFFAFDCKRKVIKMTLERFPCAFISRLVSEGTEVETRSTNYSSSANNDKIGNIK